LLQLYTSVYTALLQRTWLNCVCTSLRQRQQVVLMGFGPPQPATCGLSTYAALVLSVSLLQSPGLKVIKPFLQYCFRRRNS